MQPTQIADTVAPTKTTQPRTTTAISKTDKTLFWVLGVDGRTSSTHAKSKILNDSKLLLISSFLLSRILKVSKVTK